MLASYIFPVLQFASSISALAVPNSEPELLLDRRDDNYTIEGISITFSGCNDINPRTGNVRKKDIINAWSTVIDLAGNIKEIDLSKDAAAIDYFGPAFQTADKGYKILSVYNNMATFGRNFFWGWRVNVFCEPEDKDLWRMCNTAHAYEWDTYCPDGRCPCSTRDKNDQCAGHGADGINRDPEKSYINIMLCERWFKEKSLQEIINDNKGREPKEKYNINNYWDNREKILFHELAHAATVTKRYNDLLDVEDISIRLTQYAKDNINPGIYANQEAWVTAYGPLNAKILARTISDGNFDWVRKNDDNWSAYALAKHLEKALGFYPALPIADGRVYEKRGTQTNPPPQDVMFLLDSQDGWKLNFDAWSQDRLVGPNNGIGQDKDRTSFRDPTFRKDSNYPEWYIKQLEDLRKGIFPGEPAASPSVTYEDRCADPTKFTHFDYKRADADIRDFCKGGVELAVPAAPLWQTYDHTKNDINMKLQIAIQWSQRAQGQEGCNAFQNSNRIDENTCIEQFLTAMNRCNKETISNKYGQLPMTWNSPGGCVDFWLVGHGPDWNCDDLKDKPTECEGKRKGT